MSDLPWSLFDLIGVLLAYYAIKYHMQSNNVLEFCILYSTNRNSEIKLTFKITELSFVLIKVNKNGYSYCWKICIGS